MMIRIRLIAMVFAVGLLGGVAHAQAIDFKQEIRPILLQHCVSCHGEDRTESGLSLHSYEAVLRGSDSGKSILGGAVEANEILRRVKHQDPLERMPLEDDALSPEQIATLQRWVEQGSPWPVAKEETPESNLETASDYIKQWVSPYLPWVIGLVVFVGVVERLKAMGRKREASGGVSSACYFVLARRVSPAIYLIAVLCIVLGVVIDRALMLQRQLVEARLDRSAQSEQGSGILSVFGDPPVPIRPSHEKRLGGIYYRGNNERKPGLYNNGHYRTATLELALVDSANQELDYGDAVSSPLRLRLIIRSAPGATPVLFSESIMAGLLLTPGYDPVGMTVFASQAGMFEPIDEPGAWQAYFPLTGLDREGAGLVYLYRGKRDTDGNIHTVDMPQAGIVYDLKLEDGRVTEGSEVWMDAIYYPENVVPPAGEGRVPWTEWYDYRPIPVIEGENTKDPELLGMPEYTNGAAG